MILSQPKDLEYWLQNCDQTQKGQAALSKLRTAANEIATRYWNADPTLATDLIERIEDPVQLEKIAVRAQTKLTQRLLTDSIKAAGGE